MEFQDNAMEELNSTGDVSEQADFQEESEETLHIPVMLKEVIEHLNLPEGGCVVDCTLGLGGHAAEILKVIGCKGFLIGLDRDGDALALAEDRLKSVPGQCHFIQSDFREIGNVLDHLGIRQVDGILFDLGISSYQLDNADRGFSIKKEGPLDMRMDRSSYISAHDLVNTLSEHEISNILKEFGEERWHHRIARALVSERSRAPIESTKQLSEIVRLAIPARYRNQRIHPATRTFQAFRIAVNRELESLPEALDRCTDYLKIGGRICVISFHSLEDRIVKEKFRNLSREGRLKLLFKKPLRPGDDETLHNSRSRSARLRAAERIT